MKQKKIILVATLMLSVVTATAQSLNSAYFTDGYNFRHTMNPAYGNDQSYVSIPALGNINVRTQGNFGYDAIIKTNPRPNGNKTMTTFLNPYIDASTALEDFASGNNRVVGSVGITILSAGFKAWGGYNTIEINSKTSFGVSLPYELFEFAKNTGNKNYDIGDMYNSNHWVQFHLTKYKDGTTDLTPAQFDPTVPHDEEYELLDDCIYSLYRYVLSEGQTEVTFSRDTWTYLESYTTGQIYTTDGIRLEGELLTIIDNNVNGNYIYVLVEDSTETARRYLMALLVLILRYIIQKFLGLLHDAVVRRHHLHTIVNRPLPVEHRHHPVDLLEVEAIHDFGYHCFTLILFHNYTIISATNSTVKWSGFSVS